MIITEARRRRQSLYLLVLDGEEGPTVDAGAFDESPYRVGGAITPEELEALLADSAYRRAHSRALYLLGLRDYGCRELERKLALTAPPETAAAVVARLREVGLLDDETYARRAARGMSEYKGWPRRRVLQELQRRGVARETAAAAVEELDGSDFQQALALIRKKYYNKLSDRQERQRVMAALARRGFSYGAIRQAMEACGGGDDDLPPEE